MSISNLTLDDLLPNTLTSHPCVSIKKNEKVWSGSILLIHYLESFTDSLVVVDNESPIGIIGGKDILEEIKKNPTSELFFEKTIDQIMTTEIKQVSSSDSLSSLINHWKKTRRAFSIIPNEIGNFSAISARGLMEIGMHCSTDLKASDLPQKDTIYFNNNSSIGEVIDMMFRYHTRKLLLKESNKFISDRIILEKISRDLDHLKNCNNFLDLPAKDFLLQEAHVIGNMNLEKIYTIMFSSIHPYLIYQDQVISPWDLCLCLLSDDIRRKA